MHIKHYLTSGEAAEYLSQQLKQKVTYYDLDNLSDEVLKELRLDEIVEYQEISSTYIYHWEMLRSEWLCGTLNPICQ